jgi:hypothetical protein
VTTQQNHRGLSTRTFRRVATGATLVAVLAAVLFLAALTAGCGQTPPVPATGSPAAKTTTAQSSTSTTEAALPSNPLAGRWFFTDGTGGVMIDSGAQVSFIDPYGGIVAGPFVATDSGDSLALTLSSDDLAQAFGEDQEVGDVNFAFRAGSTKDELLAEMRTAGGEQSSMTLTRRTPSPVPPDPTSSSTTTYEPTPLPTPDPAPLDTQLEQVVARLVTGLLDCRRDLGYSPQAQDLVHGGIVEPYIPGGWPINPFTGEAVRNLAVDDPGDRQPGDIFYMYFGGETFVDYWTSDGIQRQMHVDW